MQKVNPDKLAPVTRLAMRLSLATGVLMLVGKLGAWFITGSSAILSDALESVIHVIAVAFAAYSLRLSQKPADAKYLFGYERVTFFSAGFEGAMIALAAVVIIYTAIQKWIAGIELTSLGAGTAAVAGASLVNLALGWYLIRTGKRAKSLILEANGKHVLTDCWTSAGVIGGLLLVMITGWKSFDPLCAIAVALNILWSGFELMRRSIRGLMDYADPAIGIEITRWLGEITPSLGIGYHGVRYRETGGRLIVEMHLLFPYEMELGEAHRLATTLETRLHERLGRPAEVVTHLEAFEDHGAVHTASHETGH